MSHLFIYGIAEATQNPFVLGSISGFWGSYLFSYSGFYLLGSILIIYMVLEN